MTMGAKSIVSYCALGKKKKKERPRDLGKGESVNFDFTLGDA